MSSPLKLFPTAGQWMFHVSMISRPAVRVRGLTTHAQSRMLSILARHFLGECHQPCSGSTRTRKRALLGAFSHWKTGRRGFRDRFFGRNVVRSEQAHEAAPPKLIGNEPKATWVQVTGRLLELRYKKTADGGIVSLGVFHGQDACVLPGKPAWRWPKGYSERSPEKKPP